MHSTGRLGPVQVLGAFASIAIFLSRAGLASSGIWGLQSGVYIL